jgi:signal peptidase I
MRNGRHNLSRRKARRRSSIRRVVEAVVLMVIISLTCMTWFVEGLFTPIRVCSGSMAPALRGPHYRFVCSKCGQAFSCDAAVPRPGHWRVCPHCGDTTGNDSLPDCQRGDRMLLIRSAYDWRQPRRWEMIVFREPCQPSHLAVKRVVGLPGESITLQAGDVYIDGRLVTKNLDEQLAMAVLVHDAAPDGAPGNPTNPWWRPPKSSSHWKRVEAQFRFSGSNTNPETTEGMTDWLVYHHQRPARGSMAPSPVTDELAYNQWRTEIENWVEPVRDLLLRCRASGIAGDGWLAIRAEDGEDRLEARIEPASGTCEFRRNGKIVDRGRLPGPTPATEGRIVVSLVDGQWLLAWNGCVVLRRPLEKTDETWRPSKTPWAVGAADLDVVIGQLRVYRDVYYRRPPGVLARWGFDVPVMLGPSDYFVLGDNSAISEDSRCWGAGPFLPARLIIGKAAPVPITH